MNAISSYGASILGTSHANLFLFCVYRPKRNQRPQNTKRMQLLLVCLTQLR
jgi:hypothetical protein